MRFPSFTSRRTSPSLHSFGLLVLLTSTAAAPVLRPSAAAAAGESTSPRDEREQAARRHYAQGEAAFKAEQFEVALKAFEAGYAASPRPGFLLNLAQTERKLGNLRHARSFYKKFLLIEPTSALAPQVKAIIAELDSALADEDQARQGQSSSAQRPAGSRDNRFGTEPLPAPLPPAPAPADSSLLATTQRTARDQPPEPSTPVYRRAWFWVTVGVVAAAGGGAALYASQRSPGEPFHATGSLGALGP